MKPVLVVDAYNVIHDWWSPAGGVELGMCRDRLLADMASYAAMAETRTIVVFDAHQVAGDTKTEPYAGLEVYFSGGDETADTVIERLCYGLCEAGETVTVATSDRVQAQVVFGKGVYRLSAPSLLREVRRCQAEAREAVKQRKRQEKTPLLEHPLDPGTRERLERWRRGQ